MSILETHTSRDEAVESSNSQNERHIPQILCTYGGTDPREKGRVIGERLADQIHRAVRTLRDVEAFRIQQPWWLPYPLYQTLAQWQAQGALEEPIRRHYPAKAEKLEGMAEGAGVKSSLLYLFHALEAYTATPSCTMPSIGGCTALAVRRGEDGGALLAHNFDNIPSAEPIFVLRESRGAGELRYLEFTCAPLAGTIDGVNEAGLAITYNYAFLRDACPPGPPTSLPVAEALAHCRSVPEAVSYFQNATQSGGCMLMLADRHGRVASVEMTGKTVVVRRSRWWRGNLFHSNRFCSRKARRAEVSRDALFADSCPEALRGQRVMQSPERRDRRLARLMRKAHRLDLDTVTQMMQDHGEPNEGSPDTICMHGEHWSTIASLQIQTASRTMRVSYGPACEAQYVEFSL